MGDAGEPENKLAGIGVLTFLQLSDGLDKGLLEDVVSQVMIVHNEHDVSEQLALSTG